MPSKAQERREKRKSTARRMAQQMETGFETTILKMPEGLSFFKPKEGVMYIDIVPYRAGEGNPNAEVGEKHWERSFWIWKNIGPEENNYVALAKTFRKPDPILDYKRAEARNPKADAGYLKSLVQKHRQLFLIYDHNDDELKLWEYSYHQFGKLLLSRIQKREDEKYDLFYWEDETGFTLRVEFEEKPPYGIQATAIDFEEREKPLPEKIQNHGICLDDILIEHSYEELKAIFYGNFPKTEEDVGKPEPTQQSESEKGEDKKSEPEPKKLTAENKGLSRKDDVRYKGAVYTITKISGDGTSLTLVDDDGDIEKAVDPADVEKVDEDEPTPEKTTEPESENAEDDSSGSGEIERWDDEW